MQPFKDIEELLIPISRKAPAGDDLRYDMVYDQIKTARHSDDALSQGEWQTEIKKSDWKLVISLCMETLKSRSKDLNIAAWLTEALLHHEGFNGLNSGITFIRKLLETYWKELHPAIEDGDPDFRIAALTFLNEKLPADVFKIPLCDPNRTRGFSFNNWQETKLFGPVPADDKEAKKRRQALIEEGKTTHEDFNAAVNDSSINYYSDLKNQLSESAGRIMELDQLINQLFSPDPPGLNKLLDAVEACRQLINKIYKEKQRSEVPQQEEIPSSIEKSFAPESDPQLSTIQLPDDIEERLLSNIHAVSDITTTERELWDIVSGKLNNGQLKSALDRLLAAAALAPSVRGKNRFLLLLAKLCLKAGRADLARPIVEKLYTLIETLQLDQWEHPAWIADVIETLYRCLTEHDDEETERAQQLFETLCTLNATKAAAYRRKSTT